MVPNLSPFSFLPLPSPLHDKVTPYASWHYKDTKASKDLKGTNTLIESKENWHYFYRKPDIVCKIIRTLLLRSLCLVNSFSIALSSNLTSSAWNSPPESHLPKQPPTMPSQACLKTHLSDFGSLITTWNNGHVLFVNSLPDSPNQKDAPRIGTFCLVHYYTFTLVSSTRPGCLLAPTLLN